MRARTLARASIVAVAMALAAAPARADMNKAQCVDANTKGQDLAHDGKLSAARAALSSCAVASCPALVREDCDRRLAALDAAQPSVVFEVKDASGADVTGVTVTTDGSAEARDLDGTPVRADAGEHVFVFSAKGRAAVTKKVVLAGTDRDRREPVVFGPVAAPAEAQPVPVPAAHVEPRSPASTSGGMSGLRRAGLATAVVGVAGLGLGAVFGLLTRSAWDEQQADCNTTTCTTDGHDRALAAHSRIATDSAVATAGFIAGGALLAAGVVMFVAGGRHAEPASTALVVAPAISPGGAGVSVRGAF